jgi:NADH-quinone oxidoreductase subunit D
VEAPPRAQAIRVLVCELNRISSHLVWLATTGLELGAVSIAIYGLRERNAVLDIFELITGLRMNHAYIRIGGVVMDLPSEAPERIRAFLRDMPKRMREYEELLTGNPIWRQRTIGVARLSAEECLRLGVTGPILRSAGVARDVRVDEPYCGYETYEFDIPTSTEADAFARYLIRLEEMRQSLRIAEQALARLEAEPGAVMVEDDKIGWPARLEVGPDGIGNSEAYVRHIMEDSMEALIHHFKLVTQGISVPAGEAYVPVESPRGELGAYVVSDGGRHPYRVHLRDPSFVNLQAIPPMVRGGLIADIIPVISSIDPVMGGVDR